MATQAKNVAIDTLKAQVEAWALDNLVGKIFAKEGLQARFTPSSIRRILQEPHTQKYHHLLALFDFERLLKQATRYKKTKGWHYFQVDIYDTPSLISVREEAHSTATIYNITGK